MKKFNTAILAASILGSSAAYSMAAWNNKNNPEKFEFNYETKLSELPKSGKLSLQPWSGDYWATYKGGISFRWNDKTVSTDEEKYSYDLIDMDKITDKEINRLSPAEKYDLLLGSKDYPLTNYERKRTGIMKTVAGSSTFKPGFEIPRWFGLCHAWAPATILFDNPAPVEMEADNGKKILFGSSDIKALLTSFLDIEKGTKSKFLGSRCNLDFKELKEQLDAGKISKDEYDKKYNSEECKDTNAGAFHIVLTNQISKMDQGFVVDVTRDAEVWNQAVQGYKTKIGPATDGASANAAPGTVKEALVETVMYYTVEVAPSMDNAIPSYSVREAHYSYVLELNKDGEIIGGEWKSEDRPDFLWKNKAPKFKNYFEKLEEVYKKSILKTSNDNVAYGKKLLNAAQEGNLSLVEKAIANGANINIRNTSKQTPLMLAAKYNNLKILKLLIKNNAKVNLRDVYRKTALINAVIGKDNKAQSKTLSIVKSLVSAGARIKLKDVKNKSALDYAKDQAKWYRRDSKRVYRYLRSL